MPEKNGIIHLWDLPDRKTYLLIKEHLRRELFNRGYSMLRNKTNLDKFLGLHRVHRKLYENGKYFCPLWVIKKILSVLDDEERYKLMACIEKNIEELRKNYGGRAKSIKNPKFPISFSYVLSRIAGHLVGDGGISRNMIVHYTNKLKDLTDQFKSDITDAFGEVDIYEYNDDGITQVSAPSIVGLILTAFFGRQSKGYKHVPEIVLNSDKFSKILFLRAVFDDEGSVNLSEKEIELQMTSKPILEKIKELLSEFGIRTGKISKRKKVENQRRVYRFDITGRRDLEMFNKKIGFDHPEKKQKLQDSLESYQRYQYKQGEIKIIMLDILKREKEISVKQLAYILKRKPAGRFYRQLRELRNKNLIRLEKGLVILNE
jgi:intein/homing endonuclease